MTLKQTGKWEFDCLIRDLDGQGDIESVYDLQVMGFSEWYKSIFLIDEAWLEVRENYNN